MAEWVAVAILQNWELQMRMFCAWKFSATAASLVCLRILHSCALNGQWIALEISMPLGKVHSASNCPSCLHAAIPDTM